MVGACTLSERLSGRHPLPIPAGWHGAAPPAGAALAGLTARGQGRGAGGACNWDTVHHHIVSGRLSPIIDTDEPPTAHGRLHRLTRRAAKGLV
ncbi:MAG: hypothetical protein M5U01_43085 [Ardenticatenaceae bacterium]|nr:hypothetical protein [Ardenticatenaceae bacterium]